MIKVMIVLCIFTVSTVCSRVQAGLKDDEVDCVRIERVAEDVEITDPVLAHNLAIDYYNGHCVDKNHEIAFGLFLVAAQGGLINSYHNVALMYHMGVGTIPDADVFDAMILDLLRLNFRPTEEYVCFINMVNGTGEALIDSFQIKCEDFANQNARDFLVIEKKKIEKADWIKEKGVGVN